MTIGSRNKTTTGTTSRSVFSINLDYLKAKRFGFITQECFQLVERPPVDYTSWFLAQLMVSNAIQLFNCNCRITCFSCESNNLFADDMVHIFVVPSLIAFQPFQNTPDRARVVLCLILLQGSPPFTIAFPNIFGMSPTEEYGFTAIGSSSDIIQASIYPLYRLNTGNVGRLQNALCEK